MTWLVTWMVAFSNSTSLPFIQIQRTPAKGLDKRNLLVKRLVSGPCCPDASPNPAAGSICGFEQEHGGPHQAGSFDAQDARTEPHREPPIGEHLLALPGCPSPLGPDQQGAAPAERSPAARRALGIEKPAAFGPGGETVNLLPGVRTGDLGDERAVALLDRG